MKVSRRYPGVSRFALVAALYAGPMNLAQAQQGAAQPNLGSISEGELRLDGKVMGSLGAGAWQIQANSWTSPRGVTTEFTDAKNKGVRLTADGIIHGRDSTSALQPSDVPLGAMVAVIGKNGPDGTLLAREMIVMPANGTRTGGLGTVTINAIAHDLLTKAREARDAGQMTKAIDLLNQALATSEGAGDNSGAGLVLRDLGLTYSQLEQFPKAVEAYNRSLQFSHGRAGEEAAAYNGLGSAYLHTNKIPEAIKAMEKAIELSTDATPKARSLYLSNMLSVYRAANKSEEAFHTMERLQVAQDDAGERDDATDTLSFLALLSVKRSAEDARGYLSKAAPRALQIGDAKRRGTVMTTIGRAWWYLGEKENAKAEFDAAARAYDGAGDAADAQAARSLLEILEQGSKAAPGGQAGENTPGVQTT